MRRRTVLRDIVGTAAMFVILLVVVAVIIYGENLLEHFKSH
jgi:hypothetical protein